MAKPKAPKVHTAATLAAMNDEQLAGYWNSIIPPRFSKQDAVDHMVRKYGDARVECHELALKRIPDKVMALVGTRFHHAQDGARTEYEVVEIKPGHPQSEFGSWCRDKYTKSTPALLTWTLVCRPQPPWYHEIADIDAHELHHGHEDTCPVWGERNPWDMWAENDQCCHGLAFMLVRLGDHHKSWDVRDADGKPSIEAPAEQLTKGSQVKLF